jgi:hypothetical protein
MDDSSRKPSSGPKAFDIFKPGKTAASPNSRPIIVGHNPPVQDSTLTEKPSSEAESQHNHPLMDPQDKVTVQPPANDEAPPTEGRLSADEPDAKSPESATSTPSSPDSESPAESQAQPEPVAPEQIASQNDQPAFAESPKGLSLAIDAAPQDAPQHDAESAIDSAQIVVSHHAISGKNRWLKPLLIGLLVLVLALVTLDLVLDVGTWKPARNVPHTHFFSLIFRFDF